MPSPLIVPVAEISQITPHPNADSLDIAQVLGWQCVVQKDRYHAGDKVVYFAPDTVLPKELSDTWGITQYLDRQRIKATRLRGEPSFGLVMPCDNEAWQIGDNVADDFPGVTKYEPPQRPMHGGKSIDNPCGLPRDPLFPEYTHIQNLRHFPDLIGGDELVVVTEKLHGTNSRIGIIDGEWMAGSHRIRRGEGDALYWSPKAQSGVVTLITELASHHRQVVLYGEILGRDVQSLDYGYEGYEGHRAFDLMIDGRYVDYVTFETICRHYAVSMVPVLAFGPFDLDVIRKVAQGKTTLSSGDHLREGVVVKPLIERHDPKIGRCVLKYVSDDFLLAKKSDFSEV
jgi:RNA ligase (TIGR02306 family)